MNESKKKNKDIKSQSEREKEQKPERGGGERNKVCIRKWATKTDT